MNLFKLFLALLILIVSAGWVMAADTEITQVIPDIETASAVLEAGTVMKDGIPDVNYLLWPEENYVLVLLVNVTSVTDIDNTSPHITLKHGDNPPAFRSGIGDLNLSMEAVGNYFVGPLETARFKNTTGYLKVYETNMTATVSVVEVLA
jgi:hypothetical protein